jgi:hypothetical protein
MRKWKDDASFELPELKKVMVTRWFSNPYTLGSYRFQFFSLKSYHPIPH